MPNIADITVHPTRVTSTDHPDRDEYLSQRSALRVSPCLKCHFLNLRKATTPEPACCGRCGSTRLVRPR